MPEKKCKQCAMMIPKEAKYCPHCRKRQGTHWFVMLLVIFIAFFIFVVIVSSMEQSQRQKIRIKTEQQIQLTEKGKKIQKAHPIWSNETCNTIANKHIQIGMTKDMVIAAWNKPHRVNRTVTMNRTHEQWVYGDNTYLYFDEGILTSWQD